MKIATFFICWLCGFSYSQAAGQLYSFSVKDVSFKQALQMIEAKTGYTFLYAKEDIDLRKNISLEVKEENITVILDRFLTPLQLKYSIEGKIVVVRVRKEQFAVNVTAGASAPEEEVTGLVLDENGQPLAGASVKQRNGAVVSTNTQGRFVLKLKGSERVLHISFVGYITQDIAVRNENFVTVKMLSSKSQLDDVEVVAYGTTTTTRIKTGNTGGIKAADIEKQPVVNPLLALQGRVPGIFISQGSGVPGATVTVRIQGINSLRGGNNPFYVVDGVPYTSTLLPTGGNQALWGDPQPAANAAGNNGGNGGLLEQTGSGSPLSYLNPSDIESIEVLKDADATAIYGSRAANGAILITTKKGKPGAMSVTVNLKNGWNKIVKKVELLNAQQYLNLRREAYKNSNRAIPASAYDLNGTWDTTKITDWQDYFWGRSTQYFDGQLSLSGGNANTGYLISTSFQRQTLILPGNFANKNISAHISLRNASSNQRFKSQLSINYLVNNNRLPQTSLSSSLLTLPPVYPSLLKEDGSINWAPNATGVSTILSNPMATLIDQYIMDVNNLVSNLTLSYQLLRGLEFKTSLGYTYMQSNDVSTSKLAALRPEIRPFFQRSATFRYNTIKSYLIEPQLRYHFLLSRMRIEALCGATVQKSTSSGRGITGTGQSGDNLLENLAAAKTFTPTGDLSNVYRYNALFGSVNVNYAEKYIFNITARRDGSSRFGPANRFHSFGAVGMAWVVSKEEFLHLPVFINFTKLKASYGTTGNDQIGDYSYLDLYAPTPVAIPYQGIGTLSNTKIVNDQLQWETTRKASFGLDMGFLKEQLLLGVNYSINRSSDLLQSYNLPSTAGVESILRNFTGTVQNTSWEFVVSASGGHTDRFSWSANMNLTIPRNKLVAFPENDRLYAKEIFGYVLGQPLGLQPVYKLAGVDPLTGKYMVEDVNGNATTSPNSATDKKVLINTLTPDYYAGAGAGVGYKGFRLDMFFRLVKKIGDRYYQSVDGTIPGGGLVNQPVEVLKRWRNPGDKAIYQKPLVGGDQTLASTDAAFEDASFIRFQNLSLSWAVPALWLKPAGLQSCRFSANAQNLATLTGYSGIDPESGTSALPPFRTIVLGVQLTF